MARILVFLIVLLWGCVSCTQTPPPSPKTNKVPAAPKPKEVPEKPRNTFKDLEYVYFRKGRPEWKVQAKEANRYPDRIEMTSPQIFSLQKEGLFIKARQGIYERQKDFFVFRKKVVLKTPEKGMLFTEVLYYFPRKHILTNQAPVVLKDRGLIIKGIGFEYQVSTGKLRVKQRSQVEFHG
ncbi:LPS export ABC transporter periplasmic protein LptC [Thermosulfurimonas dismutans]|uniref:LPS export ABC transporter periplasmic protein LptC n=1 Tax=Thermosulfurimonas dismutans TaxID=999894 RepID=A0A179D1N9_9BACT|nr:LPS export ABC transporter periplasmic protein LptC [Thermosulfurimonas dismutans]OAQ19903.1 hypothetical protein TDIS_2033 [Thermosulfurimonas dismutans]